MKSVIYGFLDNVLLGLLLYAFEFICIYNLGGLNMTAYPFRAYNCDNGFVVFSVFGLIVALIACTALGYFHISAPKLISTISFNGESYEVVRLDNGDISVYKGKGSRGGFGIVMMLINFLLVQFLTPIILLVWIVSIPFNIRNESKKNSEDKNNGDARHILGKSKASIALFLISILISLPQTIAVSAQTIKYKDINDLTMTVNRQIQSQSTIDSSYYVVFYAKFSNYGEEIEQISGDFDIRVGEHKYSINLRNMKFDQENSSLNFACYNLEIQKADISNFLKNNCTYEIRCTRIVFKSGVLDYSTALMSSNKYLSIKEK